MITVQNPLNIRAGCPIASTFGERFFAMLNTLADMRIALPVRGDEALQFKST